MRGHRLKVSESPQHLRWSDIPGYISLYAKARSADRTGQPAYSHFQTGSLMAGGPLTRNLGFFGEYVLYDRLPGSDRSASGFMDAYVQYADAPASERFRFLRAGNLHPYAVYALGTGGRFALTRARTLTAKLGGIVPEWNRRTFGISGGSVGMGGAQWEAGVQRGANATFVRHPDLFLTAEKSLDTHGSGIGLLSSFGSLSESGAKGGSYSRVGLTGRYQTDRTTLMGAIVTARARDAGGRVQTPDAWFVEGGRNLLPELTAFARYEDVEAAADGKAHTRVISLGITQRIPNSGRVVLEFSRDRTGLRRTRAVALDLVLMY